jgi:thiamine pyrophosphate-dependent acetolactate synthase large subunit-like protein
VVGDGCRTATAFLERIGAAGIGPSRFADEAAPLLADQEPVPVPAGAEEGTIELGAALRTIDDVFPRERTLVLDGGRWVYRAFTAVRVPEPSAYVHTLHFGSIGLGMANAIGAAVGRSDRTVLHVCGDGGFMLGGASEFTSAARHGLDIVTVVLNDRAYSAEYIQFLDRDLDPSISTFAWPDLADVARAAGGVGYTVTGLDELPTVLADAAQGRGARLVDIRISRLTSGPTGSGSH